MQMSRPVPESDFPAPSGSSKPNASPDEASILKAAMGPMPKIAKSNVPPPPPPAHADDEGDDEDDLMAGEMMRLIQTTQLKSCNSQSCFSFTLNFISLK